MTGRLLEALLAAAAGVVAATLVAAVRLVWPGASRPDFDDVQRTFVLVALAYLPVLFCVAVPYAFTLGRRFGRRRLYYYLSFAVGGAIPWLATRWLFGGPHFGVWREWAALGVLVLVACPVTAWALRARLRGTWSSETGLPAPLRGPSSMVLVTLCIGAVAISWTYAKWAALSIVRGDFRLPESLVFRNVDWVGFALAGVIGVSLVGLLVRSHRRDSGWTLPRVGIALGVSMALVPFTQYLVEFLLLPEFHENRSLPDPVLRWTPLLAVHQLLHLVPAFALLFLFRNPPATLVRRR